VASPTWGSRKPSTPPHESCLWCAASAPRVQQLLLLLLPRVLPLLLVLLLALLLLVRRRRRPLLQEGVSLEAGAPLEDWSCMQLLRPRGGLFCGGCAWPALPFPGAH